MDYINLTNALPVRDQGSKNGHLHSRIGLTSDGRFVEQSAQHHQIIQRCFFPDGRVILTYFSEEKGVITRLGEQSYNLNDLSA